MIWLDELPKVIIVIKKSSRYIYIYVFVYLFYFNWNNENKSSIIAYLTYNKEKYINKQYNCEK